MNRTLAAFAAPLLVAAAAQAQSIYAVYDLGAIPASSVCPCFAPSAMSETGYITGTYFNPTSERRSFRWFGQNVTGVMQDIGTLGGISQAADVNDSGLIVGYSVDAQGTQSAMRVDGPTVTALPTLQGGIHANANAVNNQGWIVGMSQKRAGNETWQRATLWAPGSAPIDLGTFGGAYSEAFAVNDLGQIAGWAWTPQWRQHAFVWTSSTGMIDLGTLGGQSSSAADINEHGMVVGSADDAANAQRAYRWTAATGMATLPLPPTGVASAYATAVNNSGQVVGNAFLETCQGAGLLWSGDQVYDLNSLLPAGSGWEIGGASDINDKGWIAATARPTGGGPYRAVLLVPAESLPTRRPSATFSGRR